MTSVKLESPHFVLKVSGKHKLVFKTRHIDASYLQKVAEDLIGHPDSHFTHFEIHPSDHANDEMTQTEHFIKPKLSTDL